MAFNKEKVMDAARRFVDKGQIDKAVKEYLRVVREDPKDVRVWLKIGDLYAKKGSKQEASETYLRVARFYQEQGFYLKAVAVYKQILKLDPRLVEVNLKLAELYRQLGLLSDAMQHFELVAAHFHRDGKTKEALATVRQLVDLDPENVATRIKLAELYSKEGMTVEAVTEFTAVCETLRKQSRQDDFIKVAERLLWHKPDNHELNRELAGLYLRRNDPRRALQKLQILLQGQPARRRHPRAARPGVPGPRPEVEDGVGAQGAGPHLRREQAARSGRGGPPQDPASSCPATPSRPSTWASGPRRRPGPRPSRRRRRWCRPRRARASSST